MINIDKYRLSIERLSVFDRLTDEQKIETAVKHCSVRDVVDIFTYYELEQHPYSKKLILEKYRNSPQDLFHYAGDMIGGRWLEAEPMIMTSPGYAYFYSRDVIKGRWLEAEPTIIADMAYAYYYSRDVIKDRWPEAEPIIMASPEYAYNYSLDIIKGRWPEAEPVIMKNSYWWQLYKSYFKF